MRNSDLSKRLTLYRFDRDAPTQPMIITAFHLVIPTG